MKNGKGYESKVRMACTPKQLPKALMVSAARIAREVNPTNHPPAERLASIVRGFTPSPLKIAVLTSKYWGTKGVHLSVRFLDSPPKALRKRILQHMNAWNETANVKFSETNGSAQVRISRMGGRDGGYWSYLGTDILSIASDDPTMNLEGFTLSTPESEFRRVVRHETGHTLGFPHEHMRKALVKKINPAKAIEYYGQTQGWSPEEVRAQVLTPIEEGSLMGTPEPDPDSIMCYQIPGEITKDGQPILGGTDIDDFDFKFVALFYPKAKTKAPRLPKPKAVHSISRRAAG